LTDAVVVLTVQLRDAQLKAVEASRQATEADMAACRQGLLLAKAQQTVRHHRRLQTLRFWHCELLRLAT
jgi:hypothetical protein